MLNDFTGAAHVYIACGHTDIRKGIDGLAVLVQQQFQLDPCSDALFLFVTAQQSPALTPPSNRAILIHST